MGSERPVVTYLKTPIVTPLARVRRIFFDKTFIILMESKINVHERLGAIQKELSSEPDASKRALIAEEAHDIFRSGLDQCLESLNRVILESFDELLKIAISHTEFDGIEDGLPLADQGRFQVHLHCVMAEGCGGKVEKPHLERSEEPRR